MRESRPRSKRLQGLGAGASKTSPGTLSWALAVKSALFDSMFELVGTGTTEDPYLIHAKLPLYSDGEITAGGVGSGETPGPATTLGALLNVDSEADDTPTTDKILVREAGSTHWTLTDLADISGSVTGVRMNGSLMPISNKVVDLGSVATLGTDGKVPASQLPSYVDDVLEFSSTSAFPATGESGKIFISLDTNLTYRWGGSAYVPISQSLALGETSSTAYRGDRGKAAYDHSQITGNPHGVTKSDVGLGNVENTKLSTWPGSAAITKLGMIDTGTWHGSPIAKEYLSSQVQASLDKADTALQNHQPIYQLTLQKNGIQVGTYTPNSSPSTINFPDVASAQALSNLKNWIEDMFEKDTASVPGTTLIHAKYAMYSSGELTAGGVGSGSGGGGGSVVTWTQIQGEEGGVKIATITINGNAIDVYAPAGSTPPTPTDTFVFERHTSTPVSIGSSGGTVTIRVTSTKNGINQYLNTSGISVSSGVTVQSVSASGNVTVTLSVSRNTGAARTLPITIIQPESGRSLTYSISQEAGQTTGEVVDLNGIWSVSDKYQDTYPGYTCYKSNNHEHSSIGKIFVTVTGRSSLVMYFRSEAKRGYDGLRVNIDQEPTGSNYILDTTSRQNETFDEQFKNYGLTTDTHVIYAQYEKVSSTSTDPDEAYVWVPSDIPCINSY